MAIEETILFLLIRSRETSKPSGRLNSSVRKKIAQVLPRPSPILVIIVRIDIENSFNTEIAGARNRGPC